MELYELMVNIYTGKGPAQVALKRSAPRYKRDRKLLSYDPLPDQSVDVTANKHVTMIKSKILKDDLLSINYITRDIALFVDVNYIFFTTTFGKIMPGNAWYPENPWSAYNVKCNWSVISLWFCVTHAWGTFGAGC